MGNAPPSALSEDQRLSLQGTALPACRRAADSIKSAHVLFVCIGDGLSSSLGDAADAGWPHQPSTLHTTAASNTDPARFFGVWGRRFNKSRFVVSYYMLKVSCGAKLGLLLLTLSRLLPSPPRSARPQEAYDVLQRWLDSYFSGTEAAKALVRAGGGTVDDPTEKKADGAWKQTAFMASGGEGSEMLVLDDSACPASEIKKDA